ncbi:metal-binding protein ZinT [Solibacillus sp.]|uniref:metal-binding protein ZinT n=1 Tax=Solibacillus sp. TaxID=1909654 RepID=UPI003314A1AF
MKTKASKWIGAFAMSALLVGCNAEEDPAKDNVEEVSAAVKQDDHDHDHDHTHADDEAAKKIYAGYFDDEQVQARELTDWAGDWQSVYPYLLDGTLDEVFEYKVKNGGTMTVDEYKDYYDVGYKTTIERIVIEGDQVTFTDQGQERTGTYINDGHEILTYEKGNSGVRYSFKLAEPTEGLPAYIQFSDHSIFPTVAGHYHIYLGDDRATLLEEVTHWPTYYPSSMDGHTIAHEMMAH